MWTLGIGSRDRRCCVPKCGRSSLKNPELSFYAIPKDPELEHKWLENIRVDRLFNKVNHVCSIHFEDKAHSHRRLNKNAIPTLHLGYDGLVPHKFIKHYRVRRKCCIESCKHQYTHKDLKVHKFPDNKVNKDERLAWARACNLPLPLPDKELYICARHFERKHRRSRRLYKIPGAIPKLFLNGEDGGDEEQSDAGNNASNVEQSYERKKTPRVPVKLKSSPAIKKDESNDISSLADLELSQHEEQIQKLNAEIGYDDLVPPKYIQHYTVKSKCCIESCNMQQSGVDLKVFKFPDNKDKRLAWARVCNLSLPLPDKEIYICERHFERKYISKTRLCSGAFPKFFLRSEDAEQSFGRIQAQDVEFVEVLPVKLTYSGDVEEGECDDISTEESEHQKILPHELIQNLNEQIENLKKRIIFLKNSAIYPQPGASDESLTLARMIVGAKNIGYTEEEKELAKKLRSNMFSGDYNFLKHQLGFRLPLFKAVKRSRSKKQENGS